MPCQPPAECVTASGLVKFSGTKRWSKTFAIASWLLPKELARIEVLRKQRLKRLRDQATAKATEEATPQALPPEPVATDQQPAVAARDQQIPAVDVVPAEPAAPAANVTSVEGQHHQNHPLGREQSSKEGSPADQTKQTLTMPTPLNEPVTPQGNTAPA